MGVWFVALALSATLDSIPPAVPLESRTLPVQSLALPPSAPINFDLYDLREEMRDQARNPEIDHRSIFRFKRHLGFAGGYDSGSLHGSIGFYLTVAEWGRWNFGTTSPEVGFVRHQVYDPRQKKSVVKTESTILISLASVHFRGGYLRSINKVWYVNLEQIFDSRGNYTGSQFGLSFTRP